MAIKESFLFSIKNDIESTDMHISDEEYMLDIMNKFNKNELNPIEKEILKKIIFNYSSIFNNLKSGSITAKELDKIIKGIKNSEHSKENQILQEELNTPLPDFQIDSSSKENNSESILPSSENDEPSNKPSSTEKPSRKKKRGGKRKGEGKRNLSEFIDSAPIITHPFPSNFIDTFSCPCCAANDSSYKIDPSTNVFFRRITPIAPEIHVREKLRCHSCGVTLIARAPEEVENKVGCFLPSAVTFSILMRYQYGFPFYRMERFLDNLDQNIDFSDATQWDFTEKIAQELEPLLDCLHREAANAQWLGVDDCWARVVSLKKEIKIELDTAENKKSVRTGIETTTFVAQTFSGHGIQIYMTGRNHQSENRAKIIELRTNPEPLITMSDATNKARVKTVSPSGSKIIETHCIEHLRKYYEKIAENYPDECKYFLDQIKLIYIHDNFCNEQEFNPLARLVFHQNQSQKIMDDLHAWIVNEIKNNLFAEPNGDYSRALNYARKFWKEFTEFLRVPGVKLDNNSVERGTKTPVLQRNNSRKYLTVKGAFVGDLVMSITSTAILNKINPVEYLEFCITHRNILKEDPELFLPWNYLETKKEIEEQRRKEPPYKIASQRNSFDSQEELFAVQ